MSFPIFIFNNPIIFVIDFIPLSFLVLNKLKHLIDMVWIVLSEPLIFVPVFNFLMIWMLFITICFQEFIVSWKSTYILWRCRLCSIQKCWVSEVIIIYDFLKFDN